MDDTIESEADSEAEMAHRARYLRLPAFRDEHKGPVDRESSRRDPSQAQIARMAEAIRQARWRPRDDAAEPWQPPTIRVDDLAPIEQ